MTNIYVIKCEDEKWYVGKSSDPQKRYKKHCEGGASAWTTKYKPLSLEKVIEDKSDYDEDKYVKEYMGLYGIENVRGGSYVMVELTKEQKDLLQREIWAAEDRCVRCGYSNHFVSKCYAKKDVNGRNLVAVSDITKQLEDELAKATEARKMAEAEAAATAAVRAEVVAAAAATAAATAAVRSEVAATAEAVATPTNEQKPKETSDPPTAKEVADVASKWFSGVMSKVNNEFVNPNSDLRSGWVVKKWF